MTKPDGNNPMTLVEALAATAEAKAAQEAAERLAIDSKIEALIHRLGVASNTSFVEPMLRASAKIRRGAVVFQSDTGEMVSEIEFIEGLRKSAPQIFSSPDRRSKSSGASELASRPNPYKVGATWNLTKQFELQRKDPALAERLKREAEEATW